MPAIDMDKLQATNFEFDIEENRRRRAELTNDVTELISISKFFLQHYSSDSPDLPQMPRKSKDPIIIKREKNAVNVNKARGKCSGRIAQTKKSPVTNATPTHVKRKQMRINNGRAYRIRGNDDDVPPLFDKIKLHQYCEDIVDRFFHGPPANDSEESETPKEKPVRKGQFTEKSIQTTNTNGNNNGNSKNNDNVNRGTNEIVLSKPRRNKYSTVPSRYMNQTPSKPKTETPTNRNTSPYLHVSAKSREILEQVALKGTEIRRHSCLTHNREKITLHREHQELNRSQLRFRDIHPTIDLVPSNSIFPKRILKQPDELQEPSSAEHKTDEEGSQVKYSDEHDSSANSVIELKTSTEIELQQQNVIQIKKKDDLKLQEFPVFSIKPETKCEIESIYEIEIKPTQVKSQDFFPKDKNKVIELVYESSEQKIQKVDVIPSILVQNENPRNKYIAPFAIEAHDLEKTSNENGTTDDTNVPSNLSLNLSTTSHLTDDEKFQSDKKIISDDSIEHRRISKTPAKNVIDKILEAEGLEEQNKTETPKEKLKDEKRSGNFDDLREILRRIRDDRTTLDVALDSIEQPELVSASTVDKEVQCNNLSKSESSSLRPNRVQPSPIKHSAKKTDLTLCSHHIDSSFMESPKFTKTIESIRSSARKLDFSTNYSEYRAATRQQIEKAAKKFLKTILKDADTNMPQGTSERENSSSIHLKMEKQKYQIVDDQIIQSGFNLKSSQAEYSSSSSSDATSLQLKLPSARLVTDNSRIKCNAWINQTNSEVTTNSIDECIRNLNMNVKLPQQNVQNNYSDLSDGEILSEGEFYIP